MQVYEYNSDSASCLYECGSGQGTWARAVGLKDVGSDPGGGIQDALGTAWRDAAVGIPKGACLHLMFDHNDEEAYHTRYMRDMAHKAGIRTKLVEGLGSLRWGSAGEVVDADGEEINFVWKTWAWETVRFLICALCFRILPLFRPLSPLFASTLIA